MRISDWCSDVCSSDRQHAVFGRYPALAFALQEGRDLFKHAGVAQYMRIAGLDQYGALGVARIAGFYNNRSEERRVGNECVSTCRSRWWTCHKKKNTSITTIAEQQEDKQQKNK